MFKEKTCFGFFVLQNVTIHDSKQSTENTLIIFIYILNCLSLNQLNEVIL